MDDLFSDRKFEDTCDKEDKRSLLSSIAMLIILCALVVGLLIPNLPKQLESEPAYQADATILQLNRDGSDYSATVECEHDLVKEYHQVELTKQQFMTYKENQLIKVEIKGTTCKIVN